MNGAFVRTLWPSTVHGRWMTASYEPGLVSVIIPAYNRAGVILETLESVADQTYRPIELVVVDDGSTDDTRAAVEEWGQNHAEDQGLALRVFTQRHAGAPSARNLGLIECRGEYVQYLDSDDLLHPEKLDRQVVRLASDMDADLAYSGTASFTKVADWKAAPFAGLPPSRVRSLVALLSMRGSWDNLSGIYRRRACQTIGPWNERAPMLQDWDYNVRFLLGDPHVDYVAGTLSLHRWALDDRITATRLSEVSLRGAYGLQIEWVSWINAAGQLDEETQKILADLLFGVAREALLQGYVRLAQEVVDSLSSLSLKPSRPRNFAAYAILSRLPGQLGPRLARLLRRAVQLNPAIGRHQQE